MAVCRGVLSPVKVAASGYANEIRVQAVVEIMPRSVVLVAELLDDELTATDELDFTLELLMATDELDLTLELLVATDELDLTLELLMAIDELLFTLELDTAIDELDLTLELLLFTLDELLLILDEETPVPDIGIEHSLELLLGMGSEPKVATLQLNEPFKTL